MIAAAHGRCDQELPVGGEQVAISMTGPRGDDVPHGLCRRVAFAAICGRVDDDRCAVLGESTRPSGLTGLRSIHPWIMERQQKYSLSIPRPSDHWCNDRAVEDSLGSVELAQRLHEEWLGGKPRSRIEREVWNDGGSHGRRFDRFMLTTLGVSTRRRSKQTERIDALEQQVRGLGRHPSGRIPSIRAVATAARSGIVSRCASNVE